jgi:hypothetical protein
MPDIREFVESIVDSYKFDWFVTLGYVPWRHRSCRADIKKKHIFDRFRELPPEPFSPEDRKKMRSNAEECFFQWWDDIQQCPPTGPGVSDMLWLEEYRPDGKILFHVLIAKFNGFEDVWERRWIEISHGWARTRTIGDRIAGFICYMVMKVGCVLRVNCSEFKGTYTALDFFGGW